MDTGSIEKCVQECYACALACDQCEAACLSEGHASEMAHCIQLDIECAEICRLAGASMARSGDFAMRLCALCAEVCDSCAQECRQHPADHCQRCADACERCAAACRQMAA